MPRTSNDRPYGGRRLEHFESYPADSHSPGTCEVISLQHISKHLGIAFATVKVWAYQRTIGEGTEKRHVLPAADFERYFTCEICDHYHRGWYGCNIQRWAELPDGNGRMRTWSGPDYLARHPQRPALDPFTVPHAA